MAGLQEISRSLTEAVGKAGAYTVMVEGRKRRPASGIVHAKGLVLTASHAVEREEGILLTFAGGGTASARLVGRDPARDIALLRHDGEGGEAAPHSPEKPQVGQLALSLARTAFDGINATLGIVNAAGERLSLWKGGVIEEYLQTDAARYPGFSGGPVADAEGKMLGINVFGHRYGTAIAIPARLAAELAARLLEHGSIRRGYLGIRSQPVEIPAAARSSLGKRQETGLLLIGVETGSPAEKAGLMVGDILIALDGKPVPGHEELLALLGGESVNREAAAEIVRGGALQNLRVTVGAAL